MPSISKRLAGLRAKKAGQNFENLFQSICHNKGIAITRIPDGCKQFAKKIIRVKSPFDFVISWGVRSCMIDTKTQAKGNFAYSAIDYNQVMNLLEHEKRGVVAGYLVWFRDDNQVIFFMASTLMKTKCLTGSFTPQDINGIQLGPIQSLDPTRLFRHLPYYP